MEVKNTKNRITKYFDENPNIVEARITENRLRIAAYIEENQRKVLKDFQGAFDAVFQAGTAMQKAGEKGAIAYVSLAILRSSIFSRERQLRIDLYDENACFDPHKCGGTWDVDFVYQRQAEDMVYFTKRAREELIRIQEAEMIIFMQNYLESYDDVVEEFCVQHIEDIVRLRSWEDLKKADKVKFTYGEFRDKAEIMKEIDSAEAEGSGKDE